MSIEFVCTQCGRMLKVNDRAAGRRVRCPDCASLVDVPDPAAKVEEPLDDLEIIPEEEPEAEYDERVEPQPETKPVEEPPVIVPVVPPPRPAAPKPRAVASPTGARESLPLPPRHPHPEDLIDMTAMVDIVFFLLIFFLVTSLASLESVMNMPTPQSSEAGSSTGRSVTELENDPNYITVRIEDDDSIWVEDTQVFSDQEMAVRLRAARQASDRPRTLLVLGDADASHGAAVRVFDVGSGAGVNGISLVVQEKSESGRN